VGRVCPQSIPDWFSLGTAVQTAILTGTLDQFDYDAANAALQEWLRTHPHYDQTDGRVTEDCLFLDVIVPKKIFDKAKKPGPGAGPGGPGGPKSGGAPVVIW